MTELVPGSWLEDWILGERLGQGGFAQVFRARQQPGGALAAIKVGDPEHLRREAGAAGLDHPHVTKIREARLDHDPPFLVLELVEGRSLREELAAGRCTARRAAELVQALAHALDHAHERGVLHLDLKPENVLLDAQGQPRLCDFGAACTQDAEALRQSVVLSESELARTGTPDYAAPELRAGQGVLDRRADVYGLGVLAFELLTGSVPLGLDRPSVLAPELPAEVDAVLERALARDPQRRPLSAGALASDLNQALAGPPAETPSTRPRSGARRRLSWLALACVLVGLLYAVPRLPASSPAHPRSALETRLQGLLDRRTGRVAVLPTIDLDVEASARAGRLGLALIQALPDPGRALQATGPELLERTRRDQLARESGCRLAVQAVIPPDADDVAEDCVLFLVELSPYRVVAADDPRPGPAAALAQALLKRLPARTRGALALVPAVELPARASNADSAAFDASLLAALAIHPPPGVELRAPGGTVERLRNYAGDVRGALSVRLTVEVELDPVGRRADSLLRDLDDGRVVARATASWQPAAGHDANRGAPRFTVDALALRTLDGELDLALDGALSEAHRHLEAQRPRAALALLERVRARDPESGERPGLLLLASRAHRALGEPRRAVELSRQAVALEPDRPDTRTELVRASLAEAHRLYRQGKAPWYGDDDEQTLRAAYDLLHDLDLSTTPAELREQAEALLAEVEAEL